MAEKKVTGKKKFSFDEKRGKAKDYEKLGRAVQSIYESDYVTRRRLYWINFNKGIFIGFGTAVGGTVVIGLLLWALSFFNEIPFIGEIIDSIEQSIESQQ